MEILLTYCYQKNIQFVPLLFMSCQVEDLIEPPAYKEKLKELFSTWQIKFADISQEMRVQIGEKRLPKEFFEVQNHYHTQHPVMDYIRERAGYLFETKSVPVLAPRRYSKESLGVDFIGHFEGDRSTSFENRIVQLPTWKPEPSIRAVRQTNGQVIAAVVIASKTGGFFEISAGKSRSVASATRHGTGKEGKPAIAPAFFDPSRNPFQYGKGRDINISWATETGPVVSGSTNVNFADEQTILGRDGHLIGLLVAEEGGIGSVTEEGA